MSKTSFRAGHGFIKLWQCTLLWAAKQRSHKASETSKLCHKTILGRNKYDSPTLARHQLHWLPVEKRMKFKLLTLVYKCLKDQAPLYLQKLLEYQELEKETRLSGKLLLKIPKSKHKTFLDTSFAISGPKLWNKLSAAIKNATTLKEFKKMLKPTCSSKHITVSSSIIVVLLYYKPKLQNLFNVFFVKCL